MIRIVVLGRPQPAGSKRAFPNRKTGKMIVVDDAKGSRPWKQQVAGAALTEIELLEADDLFPLAGPLSVEAFFYFSRPKGHYGSGRNAERIRDSAPDCHTVKPDATKIWRCAEDALTGIVYRDDAQIVRQTVVKIYGSPERAEIAVRPYGERS